MLEKEEEEEKKKKRLPRFQKSQGTKRTSVKCFEANGR